jgi:ketosteroid isomerase-like protein
MARDDIAQLADDVFAAIESKDVDAVAALWADDVEVWHNTDNVTQTKAENLEVMKWMFDNTASLEYRDIVRTATETAFAQRHVLRLTFDDGRVAELPAAIFAEVQHGTIRRIDEYLDSADVSAAFRPTDA